MTHNARRRLYIAIATLPPGGVAFTGSRFEYLAGGGDRPEIGHRRGAHTRRRPSMHHDRIPAAHKAEGR